MEYYTEQSRKTNFDPKGPSEGEQTCSDEYYLLTSIGYNGSHLGAGACIVGPCMGGILWSLCAVGNRALFFVRCLFDCFTP
jgi:hypothetical protein